MKTCSKPNCNEKLYATGLCHKHYMREYRYTQKLKRKRQEQLQGSYEDGYEAGLGLGITIGQEQVTQTITAMLSQMNANCFVDQGQTLHLEVQGQYFRKRLSTTHD